MSEYLQLAVNVVSYRLENIAKGTTDPRVEFILQDHSSRFTNLEHIREAVKNVLADFVR